MRIDDQGDKKSTIAKQVVNSYFIVVLVISRLAFLLTSFFSLYVSSCIEGFTNQDTQISSASYFFYSQKKTDPRSCETDPSSC